VHDNVHGAIAQRRVRYFLMAQKCRWRKGFCSVLFFRDCSEQGKLATRVRLQKLSQPRVKHTKRLVQKIFCRRPRKPDREDPIRLESSESARK
jgi:hypothetical protein